MSKEAPPNSSQWINRSTTHSSPNTLQELKREADQEATEMERLRAAEAGALGRSNIVVPMPQKLSNRADDELCDCVPQELKSEADHKGGGGGAALPGEQEI